MTITTHGTGAPLIIVVDFIGVIHIMAADTGEILGMAVDIMVADIMAVDTMVATTLLIIALLITDLLIMDTIAMVQEILITLIATTEAD